MGACLSSSANATAKRNAAIDAAFGNDSMHVMLKVSSDQEMKAKQESGKIDTSASGDGYRPRSAMDLLLEKKREEAAAQRQQQEEKGDQGAKNGSEHDVNVTAANDEERSQSNAATSCSTVPGDDWRGLSQ